MSDDNSIALAAARRLEDAVGALIAAAQPGTKELGAARVAAEQAASACADEDSRVGSKGSKAAPAELIPAPADGEPEGREPQEPQGPEEDAALIRAIARCLGGLERGEIPLGPVLMYIVSAASELSRARAARAAGRPVSARVLAAARFEVESFGPGEPGPAPSTSASTGPDVPADSLSRRSD